MRRRGAWRSIVGENPRLLLLVASAALALRLVALDRRVIHFDEARVGVEVLRYLHTGEWLYYPALHGPLLFHADRTLFALVGPSDLALRLPVALVGGLLPLAAWCYRDPLRDAEVVGLALVLAVEPYLLYYSRVARNDLLVAAFALLALGFWLRLRATGRARYLYAGVAAFALAIGSKENALLYLLCWVGAGALLVALDPSVRATLPDDVPRSLARRARDWAFPLAVALLELLALLVLLFAPRGGDRPRLGAVTTFPDAAAVIDAALLGSARRLVAVWVHGGGHSIPTYAGHLALLSALLLSASLPLVAVAVVGAITEWRRGPRPLLRFALLWAGLSVVGYPYATDIVAGWTVVHVVVPLAIPAAVGMAAVWDAARTVPRERVRRRAVAGTIVGVLLVAATAGWSSYAAPGAPYNPVAQPGQAPTELRSTMETVRDVAERTDGIDVGYYGSFYGDHRVWRLPFEWYLVRGGATAATLSRPIDDPPPVVVALDVHAGELAGALDGYACVEHDPYPWGAHKPGGRLTETVVYVDRAFLDRDDAGWRPPSACGPTPSTPRPIGELLGAG